MVVLIKTLGSFLLPTHIIAQMTGVPTPVVFAVLLSANIEAYTATQHDRETLLQVVAGKVFPDRRPFPQVRVPPMSPRQAWIFCLRAYFHRHAAYYRQNPHLPTPSVAQVLDAFRAEVHKQTGLTVPGTTVSFAVLAELYRRELYRQ